MLRKSFLLFTAVVALVAVFANAGWAQSGSAIAGVVRDTSGAVLPGVTVEASSPALIEKTRTVVTDGQGQYKLVDLVPGTYSVTFTLTGFNTVKREGIELTASFTATVNADMKVGAVEETITVSGTAPTVDVQNVVEQTVKTRDVIDAVPAGTKSIMVIGALIPGATTSSQDVGGTQYSSAQLAIHGGRGGEMFLLYDGMNYANGAGRGGGFPALQTNDATVQEVSFETGGLSAESELGSIRSNIIPRDGGNTFKGVFFGSWTNHDLQSSNLGSDLQARGLTSVDRVLKIYDVDPAYGGPLVRDRLWFWGSVRAYSSTQQMAGLYNNATPGPMYTPDLSRPASEWDIDGNQSLRLTLQASPRNKVTMQFQNAQQIRDHFYSLSATVRNQAPDATIYYNARPDYFGQVGWTSPVTSRLLLEAGYAYADKNFAWYPQPGVDPNATFAYADLGTGLSWNNLTQVYGQNATGQYNTRFVASYVTGSHALKVGVTYMHAWAHTTQNVSGNQETLQLLNGVPSRVTLFAYPLTLDEVTKANVGLFAQDQWKVGRLTVNAGVRYDYLNSYVPSETNGPGPQVPTRNVTFPEVDNVPNWKNVSPRVGAAYDLFGDGKTAVKVNIGRYLEGPNLTAFTRVANPAAAIATSATRTWKDVNGDFLPQPNELGALSNVNFGNSIVTTTYAPDVLTTRGYNWEFSAAIQRELMPRVSVNVAYFRRWYGNLRVNQNTAVTSADYSPFCITAPVDARLPNGGGYQECGFYDVNPNKFGQSIVVVQEANHFGTPEDVYDGFDITEAARLPKSITVTGGVSTGRERINNCYGVNDLSLAALPTTAPHTQAYCDTRPPFQPNVKFAVVYPLPWWGLQTSAAIQSLPGPQITATTTLTSAQVAPSLGRNLSSGGNGTVTVDLIPPGTVYGDRLNQVDLRGSKIFKFSGTRRITLNVDLYNLFNADPVLALNNTFGPAWQKPLQILQGRLLKFGTQIDF